MINMSGVAAVNAIGMGMPNIGFTDIRRQAGFNPEEIGIGMGKTAQSAKEKLSKMGIDPTKVTLSELKEKVGLKDAFEKELSGLGINPTTTTLAELGEMIKGMREPQGMGRSPRFPQGMGMPPQGKAGLQQGMERSFQMYLSIATLEETLKSSVNEAFK